MTTSRRNFLIGTSAVAGSTLVMPFSVMAAQKAPKKAAKKKEEAEEDVSTNEDLMREHGVLNRVLLIYDEAIRRIQAKEKFDPAVVTKSAGIIKSFIEDYHEKLEEDHIFPRFEQAGKLIELTTNLRAQHAMGRRVTERILASATMGEQFEAIERKTFGGDGFDMAVDQVTELEKQFGIYDISQFTPSLPPAK